MRREKTLLNAYHSAVRERQNKTVAKMYLYIALLLFFSAVFF